LPKAAATAPKPEEWRSHTLLIELSSAKFLAILWVSEGRFDQPVGIMDETQKYLFDLNGYLVIPDALTVGEIAACNEALDNNQDRIRERSQSLSAGSKDSGTTSVSNKGTKRRGNAALPF
jgi:hypothetical protein